jgi:hypothetical protein
MDALVEQYFLPCWKAIVLMMKPLSVIPVLSLTSEEYLYGMLTFAWHPEAFLQYVRTGRNWSVLRTALGVGALALIPTDTGTRLPVRFSNTEFVLSRILIELLC